MGIRRREFIVGSLIGSLAGTVRASGWMNLAAAVSTPVSINKSARGWEMTNGTINVELVRSSQTVELKSLRRAGGSEWAVPGAALIAFSCKEKSEYRFSEDSISSLPKGGKQLTLHFRSESGGRLALSMKLYPGTAVIELAAKIENTGQKPLLLDAHIDPLFLTLQNPPSGLRPYSSVTGQHGFHLAGTLSSAREFQDWVVLENNVSGESVLIGGEPGLGVLGWKATIQTSSAGTVVRAGTLLIKDTTSAGPVFELAPGQAIETPIVFFALAKGDSDNVGNEAFRYLKRYVFLTPLPNAPQVGYNVWLTQTNSEELILRELDLAKRIGFDLFYHDATWNEGSSVIPGMNDWTEGLGDYHEDKDKFPHGLKSLSDAVHSQGMMFGLWVDPANVDATLVESSRISSDWQASIDGKPLSSHHPSLSPTRQLCLGDPEVVAWIKQQLGDLIERYNLDWVKWDPSSTVSYQCNRTDHGHGRSDGAYAAYRGRMEVFEYLLNRFPNLSGYECDPALRYSRSNPGPQSLLPGGYTNEFIAGPMVSPNVWGSLATAGKGDARASNLAGRWYSASALDYDLRKHFTHGVIFGNINGMSSQLLSAAPAGYVEAFQRNLLYFKQYRHLLFADVYHPKLDAAGWSSIQYVKEDAAESVIFIFRDTSEVADTTVHLRGLDPRAKYRMTSLNDRPGRQRELTARELAQGISVHLPNEWLAKGDGALDGEFADQQRYGSDILILQRLD
jgi:Melibiase/Glycosyl hydrolase family 36 C-terminal domain